MAIGWGGESDEKAGGGQGRTSEGGGRGTKCSQFTVSVVDETR